MEDGISPKQTCPGNLYRSYVMPCTQRLLYLIHFSAALCSSVQDVFPSDQIFRGVTRHMVTMDSLGPIGPKRISWRVSQVNDLLSLALFLLQQSRNILVTSKLTYSSVSGWRHFWQCSFGALYSLSFPTFLGMLLAEIMTLEASARN